MSGSRVELMTGKEQDRADDMMRAEIARLYSEMRQTNERVREEISKTRPFSVLSDLVIPMLAGAALVGVGAAVAKLFS